MKLMKTIFTLISLNALINGCTGSISTDPDRIGEGIEEVGFTGDAGSNDTTVFFAFDRYTNRLNFVNTDTGELSYSEPVTNENAQLNSSWIPGSNQSFFFGIEEDNLYLYRTGEQRETIRSFAGNIISKAINRDQGLYIFIDEFTTIFMLSVDSNGQILDSWAGSSILSAEETFVAGDLIGSQLLMATSIGTLIGIDVSASIAQKAWVNEPYPVGLDGVSWLGKAENQGNFALYYAEESQSYGVINTITKDIQPVATDADSTIVLSKNGTDHIIKIDPTNNVYSAIVLTENGEIQESPLGTLAGNINGTKVHKGYMLLIRQSSREIQYYRIRLSDGLVESRVDVLSYDKVGFTSEKVIVFQDSPLGYIELIDFESEEKETLSGFNLEFLQQ